MLQGRAYQGVFLRKQTSSKPPLITLDLPTAPAKKSGRLLRVQISFVRSDKTSTQIATAYIAPSTRIYKVNIWLAITAYT